MIRPVASLPLLVLLGCDSGSSRDLSVSSRSATSSEVVGSARQPNAASALLPASPTQASQDRVGPMTTPPLYMKRDRPSAEEWAGAVALPRRGGDSSSLCAAKKLADWISVECARELSPVLIDSLTTPEARVFATSSSGVEVRLMPGDEVRLKTLLGSGRVKVYAAWPMDESEPSVVYVQGLTARELPLLELDPPEAVPATLPGAQPPPMPGDWAKSTPVNTASESSRFDDCDLRLLRGWVRVRCADSFFFNPLVRATLEQFGQPGVDQIMRPGGSVAELVFRLEPGKSIRFESGGYPATAVLRVEWPQGADRPSVLSLEKKL